MPSTRSPSHCAPAAPKVTSSDPTAAPEIEGEQLENILEAVRSGQHGKVMDITDDEDGERVEIFVE